MTNEEYEFIFCTPSWLQDYGQEVATAFARQFDNLVMDDFMKRLTSGGRVMLYDELIKRFGKFSVSENCEFRGLPYISDIRGFVTEWEKARQALLNECLLVLRDAQRTPKVEFVNVEGGFYEFLMPVARIDDLADRVATLGIGASVLLEGDNAPD